jgi:uncharacterized repeat protein (TIGR01451 family)
MGFGILVAFVRAQDETKSVLQSIDSSAQEPALTSPPPSASLNRNEPSLIAPSQFSIGDETGSGLSDSSPSRGSSLADRINRTRNSANSGNVVQPADTNGAPITTRSQSGFNAIPRSVGVTTPARGEEPAVRPLGVPGAPTSNATPSRRRVARSPIPFATETSEEPAAETPYAPSFAPEVESEADTIPDPSMPLIETPAPMEFSPAPAASRRTQNGGELFSSVGPSLRVDTVGPSAIVLGKDAVYNITLSNFGNVIASDVYVRIELPAWVQVQEATTSAGATQSQDGTRKQQKLVWTVDQIGPQTEHRLKLKVRPTENHPFDLMVDWTIRPVSNIAQIAVQRPRLEMAVFGPKSMLFGETATYTIQLTNPGNGEADNVAVEFSYGKQRLEKKVLGTLGAGEQTEINVELTAQQVGEMRIAAIATADNGLRDESVDNVLVRRAELQVDVIGSSLKFSGGVATYKVRVKNVGNATANEVVANILLPKGAKLITGSEHDGSGRVAEEVGTLIPGAERILTVRCQLMTPGENRVEALASASGGLETSAAFVTRVDSVADLKLTVNDPRGPTAVGDESIYEVHIVNRGTKAAKQIKLVGQFSEGVEPVEANGAAADIVTGQVLFQPIPRIAPGEELVLKIVARADRPGNHRFRAELTCAEPDTRLIAEESTYYFGGDDLKFPAQAAGEQTTR